MNDVSDFNKVMMYSSITSIFSGLARAYLINDVGQKAIATTLVTMMEVEMASEAELPDHVVNLVKLVKEKYNL